jgi:hypothetical protein
LALPSSARCAEEWLYTVRAGENLWVLTERYLIDLTYVARLQRLNRIADPRRIPVGTQLRIPWAWTESSVGVARVTAVAGTVLLSSPGAQREQRPAAPASLLHVGDMIETETDANATLEFSDGTRITLLSESLLLFDELLDYSNGATWGRLHLQQGRTENQVAPRGASKSRLHIGTPAGITSVRGTQLRVSVPAHEAVSHTEVLDGAANVANAGREVLVQAGYGTVVRADQPPATPVALLPPPDLAAVPTSVPLFPIEFELGLVPGAVAYRVQLATSPAFDRIVFDAGFSAPKASLAALPNGRYALRARAIDALGLEGRNAEQPIEIAVRPQPPRALAPAEGEVLSTANPVLRWASSDPALVYQIQVSQDSAFLTLNAQLSELRGSHTTLDAPLPSGVYFWRIAAIHAEQGAGPFSAAHAFRIAPLAPAVAPASVTPTHIHVSWQSDLAARRYRVQLAADTEFRRVVSDVTADEPAVQLARPAPGRYYLRVRVLDPDGYEGPYQAPQTVALHHPPVSPRALSPAADAVVTAEPVEFRWEPTAEKVRYRFQLARDRGFEAPLLDLPALTQPSLAFDVPLAAGVYFWRVAASTEVDGPGDFGPPQSFRRAPRAPEHGLAETDAFTLSVQWQPQAGAAQYDVELAKDQAFTDVLMRSRVGAAQLRTLRPPGGRYFARVRSVDADGIAGPWGAPQTLDVRARPAPPKPLQPPSGASIVETTPLKWEAQVSGTRYRIQLRDHPQLRTPILDQRQVPVAQFLPGTLRPGVYYWRVAASTDADGEGDFSETHWFRLLPRAPELAAVEVTGNQLALRWREEPYSARYQVQLAKDAEFHAVLLDKHAATTTLQAQRPEAGDYFVRIRSIDADGNPGSYSAPHGVHVPPRFPYWLLLLPLLIFAL